MGNSTEDSTVQDRITELEWKIAEEALINCLVLLKDGNVQHAEIALSIYREVI